MDKAIGHLPLKTQTEQDEQTRTYEEGRRRAQERRQAREHVRGLERVKVQERRDVRQARGQEDDDRWWLARQEASKPVREWLDTPSNATRLDGGNMRRIVMDVDDYTHTNEYRQDVYLLQRDFAPVEPEPKHLTEFRLLLCAQWVWRKKGILRYPQGDGRIDQSCYYHAERTPSGYVLEWQNIDVPLSGGRDRAQWDHICRRAEALFGPHGAWPYHDGSTDPLPVPLRLNRKGTTTDEMDRYLSLSSDLPLSAKAAYATALRGGKQPLEGPGVEALGQMAWPELKDALDRKDPDVTIYTQFLRHVWGSDNVSNATLRMKDAMKALAAGHGLSRSTAYRRVARGEDAFLALPPPVGTLKNCPCMGCNGNNGAACLQLMSAAQDYCEKCVEGPCRMTRHMMAIGMQRPTPQLPADADAIDAELALWDENG